jgi:tRNA uridine 5-carboxymethylaminomethyl modification enzyme
MFTSRAEYRLALRADNADQRLTPLGIQLGCIREERRQLFDAKQNRLREARDILTSRSLTPKQAMEGGIVVSQDGKRRTAYDFLAFPNVTFSDLEEIWPEVASIGPEIRTQVSRDAQYASYIDRQRNDVAALKRDEARVIPDDFDYGALSGLSNEIRQKLVAVRPQTLGQAGRIEGVTPAALTLILASVRKSEHLRRA